MKENFRDRGNEIAAARITRAVRAGRRPRPAARAHPRGQPRRRRVGAAAARCRRARTRRRPTLVALPAAAGAGRRAARPRADLRDLARDLRELPGAARGDREGARPRPRAARWSCRASSAGWAWRCWSCWRSRRSSVWSSRAAPPAGWRRCAMPPSASAPAISRVRVAPRGNDELDELARAFDVMVAELGDARSRLGYLQKVSAWQEVARRLAHEIKNPLTPIQLAVQELGSKYRGDDPDYRRLLGDRAGDPERGGRRDPPPGRRLLGVRQAAQGRARAGRSRRRWSRTSRAPTPSGRRS